MYKNSYPLGSGSAVVFPSVIVVSSNHGSVSNSKLKSISKEKSSHGIFSHTMFSHTDLSILSNKFVSILVCFWFVINRNWGAWVSLCLRAPSGMLLPS